MELSHLTNIPNSCARCPTSLAYSYKQKDLFHSLKPWQALAGEKILHCFLLLFFAISFSRLAIRLSMSERASAMASCSGIGGRKTKVSARLFLEIDDTFVPTI